jgi:hypothetical protein
MVYLAIRQCPKRLKPCSPDLMQSARTSQILFAKVQRPFSANSLTPQGLTTLTAHRHLTPLRRRRLPARM